jgi:pyruvate dehydrogenase E2 component (dihydrolipoamide acetyltransferase)
MAIELVMPKLGLTMKEGLIANWLKEEGDTVKKGDGMLEIETEKLTNIIEAPTDGTLLRIVGRVGDSLPVAAVLAYIGAPGEDLPAAAAIGTATRETAPAAEAPETRRAAGRAPVRAAAEPAGAHPEELPRAADAANPAKTGGRTKVSPAARALAKKTGIDFTQLAGTGPGGRIVKADVERARANRMSAAGSVSAPPAAVSVTPYSGMRKTIGDSMHRSWMAAPMVTHHVRADVTELLSLRAQLNEDLEEGAVRIGVLDLFAKIVTRAIKDFPIMNATLADKEIRIPETVNLGIAVAVEKGLMVPVIRNAGGKDLFAVSREIKELTAKARDGTLGHADMSGGTFTISSIGGYGSVDFFTPIINQPESAILGICRTQEAPVAIGGEVVIRSLTGLSFTFDHRVIDGAPAAEFLAALLKYLAKPARAVFGG